MVNQTSLAVTWPGGERALVEDLGRLDGGSWKPRALARIRPMEALLDSAIPFVNRHSMVASIDAR